MNRKKKLFISSFIDICNKNGTLQESLKYFADRNNYEYINITKLNSAFSEGDMLCIWNRHNIQDDLAISAEKNGAIVLCFENSYLDYHESSYAIGIGYHNRPDKCFDYFKELNYIDINFPLSSPIFSGSSNILLIDQSKGFNEVGLGWKNYAQPADYIISKIKNYLETTKITIRMSPKSKLSQSEYLKSIKSLFPNHNIQISCGNSLLYDMSMHYKMVTWTSNCATAAFLSRFKVEIDGPSTILGKGIIDTKLNETDCVKIINRIRANTITPEQIKDNHLMNMLELQGLMKNKKVQRSKEDNWLLRLEI